MVNKNTIIINKMTTNKAYCDFLIDFFIRLMIYGNVYIQFDTEDKLTREFIYNFTCEMYKRKILNE